MTKHKNDVIADLHSYALKKGCTMVKNVKDCDIRIALSGARAQRKTVNIYVYHPAINKYKYVILMPCNNRLYIEPTNESGKNTYTICHKPGSNLIKVGTLNYDALKHYVGEHKLTLYVTGDSSIYYLEVKNDE